LLGLELNSCIYNFFIYTYIPSLPTISGKYQLKKEEFEHHKKNCASKEQCEICGQLITLGGMNKHVHDKHENVRKYQCEKCPYAAKSFKRLKTHLYSHDSKYW
jgi:hypothetical protein